MGEQVSWTVLKLLEWTTGYLRDHGSVSPRLDAEVLLACAMNCQRIQLYTSYDQLVDETRRARFREFVKHRAEGMPVAYLVGQKEFYSRTFQVTPAVLIPRPETEFVVVEMLDQLGAARKHEPLHILDLGTGSGILAVTAALELPRSQVVAVDRCPQALQVAAANIVRHELQDRVQVLQSDLFQELAAGQVFDLILSNPPYVSEKEFLQLERGVRDFEPRSALVAGENGLEVVLRILEQAPGWLRPGGWLIIEIAPWQAERLSQRLLADSNWTQLGFRHDLSQHARVLRVQRAPENGRG